MDRLVDRLVEQAQANASSNATAPSAPDPTQEQVHDDVVEATSFNTGLMVTMMILYASLGHKIAAKSKYVGEGSAACMLGLFTGLCILVMQKYLTEEALHQLLVFNPADFLTYLLPPIILYAGLSVKKKQFFRNVLTISAFGVLGTYIQFTIMALVLFGFSKLPNVLNFADCLALGAIFAATDSVAVLQVLKQDRNPLLYSLVFGEGVINDATAVALLRAVQALGSGLEVEGTAVVAIFGRFLYVFVASLMVGVGFGLGTAILLKVLRSHSAPQEVSLIGLLAYLSYLAGDWLGLSGIVALFCCAVTISHYALHNVSSMSRVTTISAFQTLSYVSEGAIFIYVGMDTLDPLKWQVISDAVVRLGCIMASELTHMNTYLFEAMWLFCVLLVLLLLGRAAFIFPISFLHNVWSREKLGLKEMVIIWYAGLMRGAIAVALVYYYFDPRGQAQDSHRATIIATTLLLVLFSTVVFSAATKPLLEFMLGPQGVQPDSPADRNALGSLGSGQMESHRDRFGNALYTVVTMEPGDEVANHLDPGSLVKVPPGQGGASLALLDGDSAAADMEDGKSEDQRRRLLEGNQASDASEQAEMEQQQGVSRQGHHQRSGILHGSSGLHVPPWGETNGFTDPAGPDSGTAGGGATAGHSAGIEMSEGAAQRLRAHLPPHSAAAATPAAHMPSQLQPELHPQHEQPAQLLSGNSEAPELPLPGRLLPPRSGGSSAARGHGGGSQHMTPAPSFGDLWGLAVAQQPRASSQGDMRRPMASPFAPFVQGFGQGAAASTGVAAEPDVQQSAGMQGDPLRNPLDRQTSSVSGVGKWWQQFDSKYMQPVFGGPAASGVQEVMASAAPVLDPSAPQPPSHNVQHAPQ